MKDVGGAVLAGSAPPFRCRERAADQRPSMLMLVRSAAALATRRPVLLLIMCSSLYTSEKQKARPEGETTLPPPSIQNPLSGTEFCLKSLLSSVLCLSVSLCLSLSRSLDFACLS